MYFKITSLTYRLPIILISHTYQYFLTDLLGAYLYNNYNHYILHTHTHFNYH